MFFSLLAVPIKLMFNVHLLNVSSISLCLFGLCGVKQIALYNWFSGELLNADNSTNYFWMFLILWRMAFHFDYTSFLVSET